MSPAKQRAFLLLILVVLYQEAEGLTKNLTVEANFDIQFNVYEDTSHTIPITDLSSITTDQNVYLKAEVNHMTNDQLDLFPKFCFATPSEDDNDTLSYPLIRNGCPDSNYVTDVLTDGTSTNPNFAFTTKVFRFTQVESNSIYFHCDVMLCQNGGCAVPPNSCPAVVSRRKRSASVSLTSKRISSKLTVKE